MNDQSHDLEGLPAVGSRLSDKDADPIAESRQPAAPPPTNWPLLYSAVLIELAILIVIFYAFTKAFA
jgi:hypothetical protein